MESLDNLTAPIPTPSDGAPLPAGGDRPPATSAAVPAEGEPAAAESESESASEAEQSAPVVRITRTPRQKPAKEAAPAPAGPIVARWYAVRVQSNKEDTVKRNMERKIELRGLQKKILQVVVPTEKVAEIKNGKKRTRQVKTYPGYVLVEMFMDDETWAFVREIAGVGDFVGGGGNIHQKPFPLREDEVNKIFGLEVPGQGEAKIKIDFSVGDKVKIREGPFENFDGVVEEINEEKGLVRVTVTIFGRATPVELKYWQVELI